MMDPFGRVKFKIWPRVPMFNREGRIKMIGGQSSSSGKKKRKAIGIAIAVCLLILSVAFQNCGPQKQSNSSTGQSIPAGDGRVPAPGVNSVLQNSPTPTPPPVPPAPPPPPGSTPTPPPANACMQGEYHSGPLVQPLQVHPTDKRRLVTGGKLFYPLGTYGFSFNMADNDGDSPNEDALKVFLLNQQKQVIDQHFSKSLNYYRMWLNWGTVEYRNSDEPDTWDRNVLTPYMRNGSGTAADGKPKLNLNSFNQKYFDLLRDVVDYANSKGVVLQMIMLDCWHSGQQGQNAGFYEREFYNGANNSSGVNVTDKSQWFVTSGSVWNLHQAYLRKVIDTVGNRPNIVYETCNENTFDTNRSFDRAIAELISNYEATKGFAKHLIVGPSAANSPKIDIYEHMHTPGHTAPAHKDSESILTVRQGFLAPAWSQRPAFSDNDCCGGQPSANFMRRKIWMNLTAGAHTLFFNEDSPDLAVRNNSNSLAALEYMGMVQRLLQGGKVKLDGMIPAPNDGTIVTRDVAFALYRNQDEYIIYAPYGGTFQLINRPQNYLAIWYDPRTGDSKLANAGSNFTTPNSQDWVLYVKGFSSGSTCSLPYGTTLPTYTAPVLSLNHVRNGLVHRVPQNVQGHSPFDFQYTVDVPPNKNYRRMEFEIDVKITQWSSGFGGDPRKIWHMPFWIQRGGVSDWYRNKRGNVLGLLNLIVDNGVKANLQTSIDSNIGPTMYQIEQSGNFSPGNTYHFKEVYDSEKAEITVEAWLGTSNLLTMSGPAWGISINTYNYSTVMIGLSNSETDTGPEAPSIGWEYSNIKLRLYE